MPVSWMLLVEDENGEPAPYKPAEQMQQLTDQLTDAVSQIERPRLTPLSDAQITVGATAVGLGTVPNGARFADLQLDGPIRFRVTGQAPTASIGQFESIGLLVDTPLADFRMIRAGDRNVTANVVFYA